MGFLRFFTAWKGMLRERIWSAARSPVFVRLCLQTRFRCRNPLYFGFHLQTDGRNPFDAMKSVCCMVRVLEFPAPTDAWVSTNSVV